MLCVLILYVSGGFYSLKSTPNDRFFEALIMAILFTLRFFARNLLIGNRWRNTFCVLFWYLAWGSNSGITFNNISFWCLAWGLITGLTHNKATHFLLDYGTYIPLEMECKYNFYVRAGTSKSLLMLLDCMQVRAVRYPTVLIHWSIVTMWFVFHCTIGASEIKKPVSKNCIFFRRIHLSHRTYAFIVDWLMGRT